MNLVFLVQEIVFFPYEQFEFEVLKDFPFIQISCNIVKNEADVPPNFRKMYVENKWLDWRVVDSLFNALDALWPEIFPLKSRENVDDIQKKIVNLLDFINSSEYAKDLEIFLYESYANHETFKKRGSLIKIVNLLLSISIETAIYINKPGNLAFWLEKSARIFKYFLVVSENVRDKSLSPQQQSAIISNILFPIHFYYMLYEKYRDDQKIKALVGSQIEDLLYFMIVLLDQINCKIGGFQNYNEHKSTNFVSLYQSSQIPISNLFTFEIFTNVLLSPSQDKILSFLLYETARRDRFAELEGFIFSREWKFAFTRQKIVLDYIVSNFEEDFRKYLMFLLHGLEFHSETSRKSVRIAEKNKEGLRVKFENEIYDQNLTVLEEEDVKKQNMIFISEKKNRSNKYMWDKIWKRCRTHFGTWMHPDLATQNDRRFDPKDFEFDSLPNNPLFYYKTWKYELKNRSRPFLKIELKEPAMVAKNREDIRSKKHRLLNNYQTILHMSPMKSIGSEMKPQVSGGTVNEENMNSGLLQPGSSRVKSKFIQDVRKNITNSIKAFQSKALPFFSYYKTTDDIYLQKRCQWIKTLSLRNGVLTVTSEKIIFHYDSLEQKESHLAFLCYKLTENRPFIKEWPLENVREIQRRRYILRRSALEIFLIDGSSILFNFPDSDNEEVSQKLIRLRKTKCINLQYNKTLDAKKLVDKSGILKKWLNYEISNFDYLMLLNGLSGRSYKDVTQYHVFPWVLSSYRSEKIDPENPLFFRDLSKTMGALGNPERVKIFQERFGHADPYSSVPSFHFGSHYSSPAIIFHYLIRLYPYNLGAKELQNGKFDLPDRLFFDLEDSFRCATEEISDVRELIPEFYFLPEFGLNLEKHDFGVQQSGHRVHNLRLPSWAHANPYLFIALHRNCLESDYVSKNLHNWIDLIFGYKQRGKEAEKNLNMFYYMTYEDSVKFDEIDPSLRVSTESQIVHFGQTPSQLFLKGHPSRPPKESLLQGKWISDPTANLKIYKPSSKKKSEDLNRSPKLKKRSFFSLEPKAILKMRFVSESRIIALRKSGTLSSFRWWNQSLSPALAPQTGVSLIPFSCATDKEKPLNFERFKTEAFNTLDLSLGSPIFPMQFLNLGKILVCGGHYDGRLLMISTETDAVLEVYNQHIETVTVIEEDPKENFLITGSKNGECIYWRITPEYKLLPKYYFYDHDDEITSCFISREMKIFAVSGKNGKIFVYNLISGLLMKSFRHPKNLPINNVILSSSPLACVIFFSQLDKTLYCYSINGQFIESCKEHSSFLASPMIIKWMNGIDLLVYGTEFGEVIFKEIPELKERKKAAVSVSGPVICLMQSKDKRFLLFGCSDGELTVMTDPNVNKSPGLQSQGSSSSMATSIPSEKN